MRSRHRLTLMLLLGIGLLSACHSSSPGAADVSVRAVADGRQADRPELDVARPPDDARSPDVACLESCGARTCGPDPVCGLSCGTCAEGKHCTAEGACVCDYQSCGSVCCAQGQACSSGACCTAKTCSDLGKACGLWDDTCGGSAQCAPCAYHQECAEGKCLLNVLTLNMGGIRIDPLAVRLKPLVDLLATTPITIALFQEGVGGIAALTVDSIVDVVGWVKTAGVSYNYVSRDMTGTPFIEVYKLGVLTTGQILFSDERQILESTTDWNRKAVVAGIDLPGFGRVDAYTLHVGYDQGIEGFTLQGQRLLQFVADIEAQHGAPALTVIGGDFNMSTSAASPHPLYLMLPGAGYVDTYPAVNTDAGNTFSLPGNPYIQGTPSRIDYLFIKGRATVAKSQVVLSQPGTFVSDHSAVLSSLVLQ